MKITNINLIATYINEAMKEKGYASTGELRRAIYNWRLRRSGYRGPALANKSAGQYSVYFTTGWIGNSTPQYGGRLWVRVERGKWILSLQGLQRVDTNLQKEVQILRKICTNL